MLSAWATYRRGIDDLRMLGLLRRGLIIPGRDGGKGTIQKGS